jgi:hypothetical protein
MNEQNASNLRHCRMIILIVFWHFNGNPWIINDDQKPVMIIIIHWNEEELIVKGVKPLLFPPRQYSRNPTDKKQLLKHVTMKNECTNPSRNLLKKNDDKT